MNEELIDDPVQETEEPKEPEDEKTSPGSSIEDAAQLETLRGELEAARRDAEQLRRERFLLLKGVAEDDLDYFVFKIDKLVNDETDFESAATAFLKQREKKPPAGIFRSGAKMTGGAPRAASASETMNRLIRGLSS